MRLDELKGVADEAARLVRLLDDEARALDALIEDRFLRVGERQRLLVLLAEIDDRHGGLDRRLAGIWARVLRFGSFRAQLGGGGRELAGVRGLGSGRGLIGLGARRRERHERV